MSSMNSNRCYLVMWPDDQPEMSRGARTTPQSESPRSPPKTLIRINGRNSTSSEEGNVEATANQQQSLIPVTRLGPKNSIFLHSAGYHPVLVSRDYQDMQTNLHEDSPPAVIRTNSQRVFPAEAMLDGRTFVTVSTSSGSGASNSCYDQCCSKCLLKDSENRHLRKRIQGLEEQLCRAIGNKKPKLISSVESAVIALSPHNIPTQVRNQISSGYTIANHSVIEASQSGAAGPVQLYSSPKLHTVEPSQLHTLNSTSNITSGNRNSANVNTTSTHVRDTDKEPDEYDDKIELVPGTNVFISTAKLRQILSVVKTGKQLARKLMSIYWDRKILARSTLSASSQHYEQLDSGIISAIKTYCELFDNTSRKSEIHSTMIDKCVQARRPRRSSLRQVDPISSGGYKLEQAPSPGAVNLHPIREVGSYRVSMDPPIRTDGIPTSIVKREDLTSPILQQQHTRALEIREDDSSTNVSREDDSPDQIYRVTQDLGGANGGSLMVPRLINVPHTFREHFTHHHAVTTPTVHRLTDDNTYSKITRQSTSIEETVPESDENQTLIGYVSKDEGHESMTSQANSIITTISPVETIVTQSPLVHQLSNRSLLSSTARLSKVAPSDTTRMEHSETVIFGEEECPSMMIDVTDEDCHDEMIHGEMIHDSLSDTSSESALQDEL